MYPSLTKDLSIPFLVSEGGVFVYYSVFVLVFLHSLSIAFSRTSETLSDEFPGDRRVSLSSVIELSDNIASG